MKTVRLTSIESERAFKAPIEFFSVVLVLEIVSIFGIPNVNFYTKIVGINATIRIDISNYSKNQNRSTRKIRGYIGTSSACTFPLRSATTAISWLRPSCLMAVFLFVTPPTTFHNYGRLGGGAGRRPHVKMAPSRIFFVEAAIVRASCDRGSPFPSMNPRRGQAPLAQLSSQKSNGEESQSMWVP